MRRATLCVLLLTSFGCSGTKFDPAQANARLKTQAEEMRSAMLKKDHGRMADLSFPAMVNGIGGRDKYIQHLDKMAADTKGQGFEFTDMVLAEPTAIVEGKKAIYAIIPYKIQMSGPEGAKGEKSAFLVAVSADKGANWTFIEGGGFNGDRANLLKAIPDFPAQLALPAAQSATWKK